MRGAVAKQAIREIPYGGVELLGLLEVGRMAEFTWSYVDLETEQRNRALSMLKDGMPAAAVARPASVPEARP